MLEESIVVFLEKCRPAAGSESGNDIAARRLTLGKSIAERLAGVQAYTTLPLAIALSSPCVTPPLLIHHHHTPATLDSPHHLTYSAPCESRSRPTRVRLSAIIPGFPVVRSTTFELILIENLK